MREYAMDYWKVLKLPLKTFWSLNKHVSRLRAEEDRRQLANFVAAKSADSF